MISALRKIRKRLLEESKAQRYMLYAIGEIFLVVIGILIALQINTWSKEKQNKVNEITTLENLKADLDIQKELIKEQIDFESVILSQIDSANQFVNHQGDLTQLSRLLYELSSRRTFKANRVTFNNMTSIGGMNLISNADLQNAIVRYFQRLDYVESVVNNNNLFMVDGNFGSFVSNNPLEFELDVDGNINQNKEFNSKQRYLLLSQLKYRQGAALSINKLSNELLELTEELIKEIDAVLN